MEEIVEGVKQISQERIQQRSLEEVLDFHVPQIGEQQVEVVNVLPLRWVSERAVKQFVNVLLPEILEQIVEVPHF